MDLGQLAERIADEVWQSQQSLSLLSYVESRCEDAGMDVTSLSFLKDTVTVHRRVQRIIEKRIQSCDAARQTPPIRLGEDEDHVSPTSRQGHIIVRSELETVIGGMSSREFERLCYHLLGFECKSRFLLPGQKEEGIDILAEYHFQKVSKVAAFRAVRLRFAVQCKRSEVTEPIVRLFGKDLESLGARTGKAWGFAPAWWRESPWPIVGLIYTADRATRDAREWAAANAIAIVELPHILEDLTSGVSYVPGVQTGAADASVDTAVFRSGFSEDPEQ